MLLLTKSKGHKSNSPYSGFPNHPQTKSKLHTYFYPPETDTSYQIQMGNPVVFGDSKILFYFDMTDWPQFCKFEEPSGRHVNFAKLRPLKKNWGPVCIT